MSVLTWYGIVCYITLEDQRQRREVDLQVVYTDLERKELLDYCYWRIKELNLVPGFKRVNYLENEEDLNISKVRRFTLSVTDEETK